MDRDPAHPHAGTRRALERATEAGAPEGAGPVPGGQERSIRRLLIIGTDDAARILADELRVHFPADYEVVGFVGDGPGAITGNNSKILGSRAEIDDLVRRHQIDEVMIADFARGRLGGRVPACGWAEITGGVGGEFPPADTAGDPALRDEGRGMRDEEGLAFPHPSSLVPHPSTRRAVPSRLWGVAKRCFDVCFSLVALVVGAPVVALAALAIRLTSPGPALYRQERVGCGGRLFVIYKLRTMVEGAENETGPILARRDDPRSTMLGRILRVSKLDEWPQFYNVLRGDMSVVGPRPERPCFVGVFRRHIPAYSQRHTVRPGITGLAQVKGGYRTNVYVKLRYDLIYIHRQSLWLDLWILARTPLTILESIRGRHLPGS